MAAPYLPPGEELDAEVARLVFGSNVQPVEKSWTWEDWGSSDHPTNHGGLGILPGPTPFPNDTVGWAIPSYSESYEDFELLVDRINADHEFILHLANTHDDDAPWVADLFGGKAGRYTASGLTMPHALALCAVRAYVKEAPSERSSGLR